MFTQFIVQPIFNLLALIYAILPGHNFGLSVIIFTIIIRLLLWPILKKQLHQTKAMRRLQPDIKKVKAASKGDRAKESQLLMELYKERGINPFATFPTLIVQLVILIGLYIGLQRVIHDPHQIVEFAYPAIQNLSWMQQVSHNIHLFDNTLFGVIDLSRAAIGKMPFYFPAFVLVAGSAIAQFYQSKQLLPQTENQRSLRDILKSAGNGKQADQTEVSAAVGQTTRYLIPVMIFIFTINLASALSLYWLVGGIVAFIQQSIVLNQDEVEMEAIADRPSKKNLAAIPEAEVVEAPAKTKHKSKKATKKSSKRRK